VIELLAPEPGCIYSGLSLSLTHTYARSVGSERNPTTGRPRRAAPVDQSYDEDTTLVCLVT